ncbi:putative TrmB family transcriptional regulator [Methanocella paludicola SANAE]|uniref:TrmB family transcriptional regulator n=1 Tax=Methanocella paludicola (strain DSM 17711 / JCM 13418 / NBRC 101707 / SANAE) TaxID=304371 RepID=D1YV57_METPS|nr:TrmB family transcriptional regulator [Methanocella paludicola]BAI60329.1 putative TrmB family transcriptional regulator [Methanocella paludicola SANAE]
MNSISNGLVESLKMLGLTEYEAKVYSALVMFDRAEVKQVYEYLDAPKPSVYQSLRSLTDKGLVQVVNSKPAIYRATPPKIAIKHMMEAHRKAEDMALQELEEIEKSRVESDYPDVLWTLYGEENIEHKMEEMLGKAKHSLVMILPRDHVHYLDMLRGKDISAELIVFGSDVKAAVESYGLKNAKVHDAFSIDLSDLHMLLKYFEAFPLPPDRIDKFLLVAADNQEFMYIPPIPGPIPSGMTSRNQFVLALMNTVFHILWDRTS